MKSGKVLSFECPVMERVMIRLGFWSVGRVGFVGFVWFVGRDGFGGSVWFAGGGGFDGDDGLVEGLGQGIVGWDG